MIFKNLTKNVQRIRVGYSDVVCLPADDYDELISQFYKLYHIKQEQIDNLSRQSMVINETAPKDQNALLNAKEVSQLLGISRSSFYRFLKEVPNAPKPIKFDRATRYKYSEVLKFISAYSKN